MKLWHCIQNRSRSCNTLGCRMTGVRAAKEGILTFLDSHVEAAPGWLPPLMKAIQTDRKVSDVIVLVNSRGFLQLTKLEV